MSTCLQIAIDGPVAAGKGTVARSLAAQLGFLYVDTGAMYRAATLLFLRCGLAITDDNKVQLKQVLQHANISQVNEIINSGQLQTKTFLDGQDVSAKIRKQDVNLQVSVVSALPFVREILVAKQQKIANEQAVVMEGRDIGTNVLPNADIKIFLTTTLEVRAKRRWRQLHQQNPTLTLIQVQEQIAERDRQDTQRTINPLRPANDALIFDDSELTVEQTIADLLAIIKDKLNLA